MAKILEEQPDSTVRRPADRDEAERRRADHEQTTDAPRWGHPGTSIRERGYPREGGEPPAERERRVANPKKDDSRE